MDSVLEDAINGLAGQSGLLDTTMKLADGRLVDNPRRAGEVAWRDALRHETEQTGDTTAVEIQIEVK